MPQKKNLMISLVQAEIAWEDPETNRARFSEKINALPETDLVILPEMFTTGFSMNAENLAEQPEGETLSWMKKTAMEKQAAVTGSVIVVENEKYYNRLYFVFPDGKYETYDKKHLFSFADEHKTYSPGDKKLIVEYLGWKICPLVCYDLRFPVWSRNVEDYDLLIYVANWPQARVQAWDALLRARAVENMCYSVGVNGIGVDGNAHPYSGHSAVYGPLGNRLSTDDFEKEFSETISLSKTELEETRKKMAFLDDRDDFEFK
jgi:predicted amidohydrolase